MSDPLASFRGPDGELCPRTNLERELDHQAAELEGEDLAGELEAGEWTGGRR